MNLQKRECPINIEFYDVGAGWLHMKLSIDNNEIELRTSYCTGDGFHSLLESIYYLHPNVFDHDWNEKIVENITIKAIDGDSEVDCEVPYKAEFYWDEEGSTIDWKFEHKPTLDREFDLNIKLGIQRDDIEELKEYNVSYVYKLCAIHLYLIKNL